MADAVVVEANVNAPVATTKQAEKISGAAQGIGIPVYEDSTASFKLKACDANALASAKCVGITLNEVAGANQPQRIVTDGTYDPGFTAVEGVVYVVSETAGGICPIADLTTDAYVTILGVGNSDGDIALSIFASGSQVQ